MLALRLVAVLLCLCAGGQALAAKHVWVVLGGATALYQDAAIALQATLERRLGTGVRWTVGLWEAMPRSGGSPDAVVAIGAGSWRDVVAHFGPTPRSPPLIATLLPAQSYRETRRQFPALPATAVWLDQEPIRQARLIRELLPKATRVGVLLGPDSALARQALAEALQRVELEGNLIEGSENTLAEALVRVFDRADAVLVLADRSVANTQTLPVVLAASFRRAVPVFAYSPGLVNAGALAAVYSTAAQSGEAAAAALFAVLDGQALPEPAGVNDFDLGINASVARSLGVAADAGTLVKRLRVFESLRNKP